MDHRHFVKSVCAITLFIFVLVGCGSSATRVTSLIATSTQILAVVSSTSTPTPTETPQSTKTPIPTGTFTPQVLGSVFPEKCTSQAIWTNAGASDEKQRGWIKIDNGYLIHFDVALPNNLKPDDYILSPVNGKIINIYYVPEPNSAYAIEIEVEGNIKGVESIFQNTTEINFLSHAGTFPFTYSLSSVKSMTISLAHLEGFAPKIEVGEHVKVGNPLATVDFHQPFRPKKIGYVFSLYMTNGNRYDFSPCLAENKDLFCKPKCYPGAIRCP